MWDSQDERHDSNKPFPIRSGRRIFSGLRLLLNQGRTGEPQKMQNTVLKGFVPCIGIKKIRVRMFAPKDPNFSYAAGSRARGGGLKLHRQWSGTGE